MAASLSAQEQQYYDRLFDAVNKDDSGVLPGSDALSFLTSSGLPQQTLGEIWAVADPDNNGFLTKEGFYTVTRLIGWAQSTGLSQVDPALASKPGPLPKFNGYPGPPSATPSVSALSPSSTGGQLPALTPVDRTKFTRIFVGCGPANGLVTGEKARNVFLKSKLPYDKLAQIWQLADTQDRGALDLTDFIIGMHLIQVCMANPSLVLPASLPPGLYEAASNGRPQPNIKHSVRPTSPSHAQSAGPLQRQVTGTLQPQITGQSFSATTNTPPRSSTMTPTRQTSTALPHATYAVGAGHNRVNSGTTEPWDVSPDAKITSDRFFAQLDPQNRGVVEGDVAVPFMLQSQLDESTLASIWDLADIRQEGKLDRDEFAVAMHLINAKLAGQDLPTSLPNSLIPPNLRDSVPGGQPNSNQPSTASKDLFDLFNDSNETSASSAFGPAVAPATTPFLPQPPSRRGTGAAPSRQLSATRATQGAESLPSALAVPASQSTSLQPSADLLGDDGPSGALDKSADVGNKKLQLENTNRGITQLEKDKADLTRQESSNLADLQALEGELSSARSKHEAETKAVSELRVRVGEQTAKLKQLRADVISAESDLNAMRMEKDEMEQSFLRDKEEVRGLQKQIRELEDEKSGLKLLLEKIRKEARQQKGLVSIAKKQVSTAEAARDSAQTEVRFAEGAAQTVPVAEPSAVSANPQTTKPLSPNATGTSQRSLNPFERFRTPSADASPGLLVAGGAGVMAGAVLGGAALTSNLGASAEKTSDSGPTEATGPAPSGLVERDPFALPMPSTSAEGRPQAVSEGPFTQETPGKEISGAVTDFDAAFADFDTNEPPAPSDVQPPRAEDVGQSVPNADHGNPEHTLSAAAASASTNEVQPSSVTDRYLETGNSLAPNQPTQAMAVGPRSNDVESSDDEEGPEDVDGPRRSYGAEQLAGSPDAVQRSDSLNGDGEHSAARIRRHAPPPPAARQSSRSDRVVSPAGDPQIDVTSAPSPTSPAVDPFGAPVDSAAVPTLPAASHIPRSIQTDFGESFDPLTTAPDVTSTSTPALPGAFPRPTPSWGPGDVETVPKASEFDDNNEFNFPNIPFATAKEDPQGQPAQTEAVAAVALQPGSSQTVITRERDQTQDPHALLTTQHVQQQIQEPSGPLPTQHQQPQQSASDAFEDEFADFDDDFGNFPSQPTSGSDNNSSLLRSYEVVNPVKPSTEQPNSAPGGFDEWGIPQSIPTPSQPAALSFDDAFGGDFAPSPSHSPAAAPVASNTAAAHTPPIPARPNPPSAKPSNDAPQADDLEDVKRLCGMGFPRSLVVEALDANGYDFQKALNVLLVK